MAYPIITLVFAAGVAFLAFRTNGTDTGMADEAAPAAVDTSAPADADEAPPADVEEEAPAE